MRDWSNFWVRIGSDKYLIVKESKKCFGANTKFGVSCDKSFHRRERN